MNADSQTIDFCSLTKTLLGLDNCGTADDNSICIISVAQDSEGGYFKSDLFQGVDPNLPDSSGPVGGSAAHGGPVESSSAEVGPVGGG